MPDPTNFTCFYLILLLSNYLLDIFTALNLNKVRMTMAKYLKKTLKFSHLPVHIAAARHTAAFYLVFLSVAQVLSFQNVPQSPAEILRSWTEFPEQLSKCSLSYFIPIPSNCTPW